MLSDVVSTLKSDVVSTLQSDVISTLQYDVKTTLKSNVVSTLKFDVETTLKIGCFPDVEINNVVSTLKIGFQRSDLKSTLKQLCVPAGLALPYALLVMIILFLSLS